MVIDIIVYLLSMYISAIRAGVQCALDLGNSIFLFLNRELFDLRNIFLVNLETGLPKKMPYVGEFASWDLS